MFTKAELKQIAQAIARSAEAVLMTYADENTGERGTRERDVNIAREIGNNTAAVVYATIDEMLPQLDDDLQTAARASIWASQDSTTGRAGINAAGAMLIERCLGGTYTEALDLLEMRLFALFLAVRHLRGLPSECKFAHRIDPNTGACERCGERNMERDNVTPAYLRELRALAVTHGHASLLEEQKTAAWVTDAIASPSFTDPEALDEILTARFSNRRVAYDLSDREANDLAASKGYKVVHGGSLPGEVWDKVKAAGLIQPAGQVTPSPKPFSPDGESELSTPIKLGVEVYRWVGKKLLGTEPKVLVTGDASWGCLACYRPGRLILNLGLLGEKHFRDRKAIYKLAIHEYAHHFESNHLSEQFHDACCDLGAKLAAFFDEWGGGHLAIEDDRQLPSEALSSDALDRRVLS